MLLKNNLNKKYKKVFHSQSSIGVVRKKNEDFAYSGTNSLLDNLIIVCDGLGSYLGSEKASEIVGNVFINSFLDCEYQLTSKEKWFKNNILKAKQKFKKHISQFNDHLQMSTTLVLALIIKNDVHVFWIGDSRAYFITKKNVNQITDDHNLLNHLISLGKTEDEIKKYGGSLLAITNCITASQETQKYDYVKYKLKKNIFVFLASDGFYNFYKLDILFEILNSYDEKNIKNIADKLINTAISNQSNDNISFAYFGYIKP